MSLRMKLSLLLGVSLFQGPLYGQTQDGQTQDGQTQEGEKPFFIAQMSGCFKVVFRYVEDGVHDKVFAPVYEKAQVTRENPWTITRTMWVEGTVVPHWSEEWLPKEGGVWQQTVYGPGGNLRYQCEGVWTMNQWSCTALKAPKPTRDTEMPYAFIDRENTLQVNPVRWVHMQANQKKLEDGSLYRVEVGFNTYDRVDESFCGG